MPVFNKNSQVSVGIMIQVSGKESLIIELGI